MKKFISFALSVVMLCSLVAGLNISASALESSGSCGDNVTYTYENGVLTISGTGAIDDSSFFGETRINKIVIINGVTSIGYSAFYGCSGLISITIPDSVTSIGDLAFSHCSSLTSISVDSGNKKYDSRNNCNAIIETSTNTLLYGCKNTSIPNSVTDIGYSAFYGCSGLTSITIPDSVTSIGYCAFNDCSGLTSISVDSGNKKYDSRNNCNAIIKTSTNTLLYGCKNTIIPNSVISIGEYTFRGCSGLTSITIPDSVTSIGAYAFSSCSGLTSITIPDSVISIDEGTFSSCSGLTSITIPNSVISINYYAFEDCNGLTSITIPDSVTSIGDLAFSSCSGLTRITIPDSVTTIGDGAFRGCTGLTSVSVDSGNKKYDSRNDCNAIIKTSTNTLLYGCKNTIIPNSVTSIESSAFYGCSGLTSITIPDSVTSIGYSVFYGCSGLTNISVDSGNEKYDSRNNCNAIIETSTNTLLYGCKNTIIPNSVTSIESSAFYGCSGLTSVTIPDSVTSIGDSAFSSCENLENITILNPTCEIAENLYDITIPYETTIYGYMNSTAQKYAQRYNYKFIAIDGEHTHSWDNGIVLKSATCTETGMTKYTCSVCNETYTETIPATGHNYGKTTIKPATFSANGGKVTSCTVCGESTIFSIPKIKTVSLSKTSYTYNGKVQTPAVTVKDIKGKILKKGTDYTVTYARGRKNVGKYAVKVTFKGNYTGSKMLYFNINPKGTSISKLTKGKKKFTVKWKKQATQTTGYQVQYSTDKKFKKGNKIVTVKGAKKTSKSISKLKGKKKYYVRVRTYKTVKGKNYYSSWSKVKSVTTKK